MKPLLRTGLALLALLLCNCEGLRCSQDGSRFPLDPTSVLNDSDLLGGADGTDAQGNSVNWEPAPANLRDRLKTPSATAPAALSMLATALSTASLNRARPTPAIRAIPCGRC